MHQAECPSPTCRIMLAVQGLNDLEQGIVSGFLLIFFSELGDKTFFIALLLSLKQSKPVVFAGTFGALAIMTVISVRLHLCLVCYCSAQGMTLVLRTCVCPCCLQVALGELIHKADQVLPFNGLPVDDILATGLLIFFGVRTLQAGPRCSRCCVHTSPHPLPGYDCTSAADQGHCQQAAVCIYPLSRMQHHVCLQEAGNAETGAEEERGEAQEAVTKLEAGEVFPLDSVGPTASSCSSRLYAARRLWRQSVVGSSDRPLQPAEGCMVLVAESGMISRTLRC